MITANESEEVEGACLCGAVRFAITLPAKWCAHCHCSMCRRAHGAAFVTWVGMEARRFRMTAGEEHLASHRSSEAATRSFCRDCGSPLFFRSTRWADEVHISRASLPEHPRLVPKAHAFFSDRAGWVEVHDTLKRFGGPSGTEPLDG
jgi:hypothetical protein